MITIPNEDLVKPAHDIFQIQGALDGGGMDSPGPLSVVSGTARPDGLPLFAPTDEDNVEGYCGFGCITPNTDDGAISVLYNTPIAGFQGVVAGKKVFIGNAGVTQDTSLVAAPDATPTLTEGSAGALGAGTYKVAASFVDSEDNESAVGVVASVTITANKKIHVADFEQPLPTDVASVNWYMSKAAGSDTLAFIANNSGANFDINALPASDADAPKASVATSDKAIGIGLADQMIFFFGAGN